MRILRCALAALLLTGAGTVGVSAAPAAAASCTGVWVVVDFGSLGGTDTTCVPGDPKTGIAALTQAGHSIAYVPGKGPFVCSIDGRPYCKGTPPTDAYWGYWYRDAGQSSWTYSTRGAHARDPKPGSAEGWSFGDGSQPPPAPPAQEQAEPPAPPAPEPKPTRTSRPRPSTVQPPRGTGAKPPSDPAPTRRSSSAPEPGSETSQRPATPAPVRTGGAAPLPSAAAAPSAAATAQDSAPAAPPKPPAATTATGTAGQTSATPPVTASPRTEPLAGSTPDDGGGTPLPAILGVLLVVALGALGTWLARRRTQA